MKKIFIAFIVTFTLLFNACKKYKTIQNDSDSKLYIAGRLFIKDSINDIGIVKPVKTKDVQLSLFYKGDTTNLLLTAKTDSNGYFSFNNLKQDAEYTIYSETETGSGDFKLPFISKNEVKLTASIDNLTPLLELNEKKGNGVLITIRDSATQGLMDNCATCFFSSRLIWQRDTCNYGLFSVNSNINGRVVKTNIAPGKYYLLFKKQVGSLLLQNKDSIEVTNSGLKRATVFIK